MIGHKSPFRNQRRTFRNVGTPYGDKPTENARGLFPSRKSGRQIHFWTQGELDFIKLAETARSVCRFDERPERVALRSGAKWEHYVPHFRVELERRVIIVELSHLGRPTTDRKVEVADLAAAHYRRQGVQLVGLAHAICRATPRTTEANLLMRHLSVTPHVENILRVHDQLWLGPLAIRDVAAEAKVAIGLVLSMLRRGELSRASAGVLDNESLVGLPQEVRR